MHSPNVSLRKVVDLPLFTPLEKYLKLSKFLLYPNCKAVPLPLKTTATESKWYYEVFLMP